MNSLKYDRVRVVSHPRSGSHYTMRLLDLNFSDGNDYLQFYGGHPFGFEERARGYFQSNQAVIYTCRNISSTVDSIYRMRHRFGLNEDDYDKFQTTPMSKMFDSSVNVNAIRDIITERDTITKVDTLFARHDLTVGQYISKHIESWSGYKNNPNFLLVNYDHLVGNFHSTMASIAKFLGSDKTSFDNETKRVGWREADDNSWSEDK